jgi:glycerol-3-phosphate dehydrogenase subunit B
MSCGALEIAYAPALSAASGPGAALTAHLKDIVHHRPRHPYGLMGAEAAQAHIQGGYSLLAAALSGTGLDVPQSLGWAQRNVATLSALGCLLPTAMPLGPHRGWSPLSPEPWGVIQIAQDPGFDAGRICRGAQHDAQTLGHTPPQLLPIVVHMPQMQGHYASPFALARALDDREACMALGAAIARQTDGHGLAGVLLPPVVGLEHFAEARQWLAESIGLPVVEALSHLPSVPGLRLQRALDAAVDQAGIQRVGAVADAKGADGRLQRIALADGSHVDGGAFVLATGRFVAGGVAWEGPTAKETLLGLPLVTEIGHLEARSPQPVVRESPAEAHPLMTAGVGVDTRLQPLQENLPAWRNLFAAGMVLGGFSARYLLCADGVALATAHRAAMGALGAAGRA